jgi:hypothetical protein
VEGSATGLEILGVLPLNMNNRFARAVANATEGHGQVELVHITVEESGSYFFFLTVSKVLVRGTLMKLK